MDRWAVEYGDRASFICVGCAGPALAGAFGRELELRHCKNTYVPQGAGPFWGQLGCNGLIIMDGELNVVCPASMAFMEFQHEAFRHVEAILDLLIEQAGGSAPKRARLDVDLEVGQPGCGDGPSGGG